MSPAPQNFPLSTRKLFKRWLKMPHQKNGKYYATAIDFPTPLGLSQSSLVYFYLCNAFKLNYLQLLRFSSSVENKNCTKIVELENPLVSRAVKCTRNCNRYIVQRKERKITRIET